MDTRNTNDSMGYFTPDRSAEVVNARMGKAINPRLAALMGSLVGHLHGFAREVGLTQDEWDVAIKFLTEVGQMSSPERQEFILLSDTLGLSMLVDSINNHRPAGATETTVFGPFHIEGAPVLEMGSNICLDGKGEPCLFEGHVLSIDGSPIAYAHIDVWSDNADGYYDVQQPGIQPKWNNRGVFVTGPDGKYSFRGIKPVPYPVPEDGPVGRMLAVLGRDPYRPAHMHFMIRAPGFQKLITHTFFSGDPYLKSDTVFGVKKSLVATLEPAGRRGEWRSAFDFILAPIV